MSEKLEKLLAFYCELKILELNIPDNDCYTNEFCEELKNKLWRITDSTGGSSK